jgi:lysophospholipase L1-like esterase
MAVFKPKICLIGDSTMGTIIDYLKPQTKGIITDISIAGGNAEGQLAGWNALSESQQQAFDYVVIQIGLNNIAVSGDSAATLIGKIQAIFDQVYADKKAACKIISSTMTPIGANLDAGELAIWQAVNEAYRGEGATPFAHADLYASYHTEKLNDGSDALDAAYDSGDGTHPNLAGREVCADDYREYIDFIYYQ